MQASAGSSMNAKAIKTYIKPASPFLYPQISSTHIQIRAELYIPPPQNGNKERQARRTLHGAHAEWHSDIGVP